MSQIWNSLTGALADAIGALEGVFDGLFGVHAWGWAIIALTLIVRVLLLPLAIKQTRSMRAMQALQPQIKKIQKKYKTDRELLKKDPQKYQERKRAMNEEVMALYKEHDVNPASGCLPLLPQIPIFFALFSVLRSEDFAGADEPFYFFTDFVQQGADFAGLGAQVNEAGWPGWLLIVAMAGTMFITQRQMMARNSTAEGPQLQQQKILMYVMPVFLAFISLSLPLGVLLYWVTTNAWQGVQQFVILREVQAHPDGPGSEVATPKAARRSTGNGRDVSNPRKSSNRGGASAKGGNGQRPDRPSSSSKQPTQKRTSDHLPRRKRSGPR